MADLLDGKTVIVTGGASGIGRAISVRLASEGAYVIVADLRRDPREGGRPTDELAAAAGVGAQFVAADVTASDGIAEAVAAAATRGGVDVLVNNAGVFGTQPFLETRGEDFDRIVSVNQRGAFFSAQAAARAMVERGTGGVIVNTSSCAGIQGFGGFSLYCMTKAAIRLLTFSIAEELGPHGIRVNAICPGFVDTLMNRTDVEVIGTEAEQALISQIPLGRIASPGDIANGVLYLACDLSSYVTGAALKVDGGMILS